MKWQKIADANVIHFWKKAEDDDCGEGPDNMVGVPPDWYDGNGTPICQCGQDMVYSHTEVRLA